MNNRVTETLSLRNPDQTRRRLLVAGMYFCMSLSVGALGFGGNSRWILLALVPFVLTLIIYLRFIQPIANEVTNRKAAELDERQLSVRDRAHYHAYQIIGGAIILGVVCAMWATALLQAPLSMTGQHFAALFAFFFLLVVSLPASVLTWTEPDPPSGEG